MVAYSKNSSKIVSQRITLLQVLFLVFALIVLSRLFYLQIIQHKVYENLALQKHTTLEKIIPDRGQIFVYDNNQLLPVASNEQTYLLFGVPALIKNVTSTLAQIEKVLPMSDEERWQVFLRLSKINDPYEPIRKNVTQIQKERLESLKISAIGFEKESKRIYPQNELFSDVVGFVGYQGDQRVGQYGIEEYFEKELAGQTTLVKTEKDPKGRLISFGKNELTTNKNGAHLVLTLEPAIQFKICEILKNWQEKMAADNSTAIVLDPATGKILAMCDQPSFNLNNYSQVESSEIYLNSAVNVVYEPGSVFKPISMAAGIELDKVNPDTQYVDQGFLEIGSDKIRNAGNRTYGQVTMTQVLENSINTGAAHVGLQLGHKNLKKYMGYFGFGEKTKITLPAEASGDISSLDRKSDIYLATASYGQGILVTPLQLIMAYAAIANQGVLMQPQIVSEIHSADGKIDKIESQEVGRAISSKTANILKAMLVSVVKNGQGHRAGVDNYYLAGKTGTANIAAPHGGYLKNAVNHTFVGFGPVDQPKFVILVKFSKPKNVSYSSDSAAPAFAEMAKFLLHYYQIPPDF